MNLFNTLSKLKYTQKYKYTLEKKSTDMGREGD